MCNDKLLNFNLGLESCTVSRKLVLSNSIWSTISSTSGGEVLYSKLIDGRCRVRFLDVLVDQAFCSFLRYFSETHVNTGQNPLERSPKEGISLLVPGPSSNSWAYIWNKPIDPWSCVLYYLFLSMSKFSLGWMPLKKKIWMFLFFWIELRLKWTYSCIPPH